MDAISLVSHQALSLLQAYCLLITYCLLYILPLYCCPTARPSPKKSRNAPEVIQARIRAVSLSTFMCSLITFVILCFSAQNLDSKSTLRSTLHLMGYWPVGFVEALKALLLTSVLFAGPLYEHLFIDGAWKELFQLGFLKLVWSDWPTWRNLVAGPVTEECLFRSATIPLLLMAVGSDIKSILFQSPLVFGLAHLHHYYEFRITNPQVSPSTAIARSVFQFCYTSIFGVYATFIFLRTGSLFAAISVHMLCNFIGLPRLWGSLTPHWSSQTSLVPLALWTFVYYFLLAVGVFIWWSKLFSLTQSSMVLTAF